MNSKGNLKGNKLRINPPPRLIRITFCIRLHLIASNRKPKEKQLKLGGQLLSLTIGAQSCNDSFQHGLFQQLSDVTRHRGSSHLSALPSSAGWFVRLGWHLPGPKCLPHFQESCSNNRERKGLSLPLSLFSEQRNVSQKPLAHFSGYLTGLESILWPFLSNSWQE